jgi:predicted dehydrogenase
MPSIWKLRPKSRKDAYVEKPLAMDMESLKRCCDAVTASGIVVQVGTQVRSFPTSTGCRDLFRTGVFGKVSRIEQCRNGTALLVFVDAARRADPGRGCRLEASS